MNNYMAELCELNNSIKYTTFFSEDNEDIYHYTSPGAFKSIIENQKLRFTDRYYLNDSSEGKVVMEICQDKIDEIVPDDAVEFKNALREECKKRYQNPRKDNFYVFQCSFSLDKDSLCLWNYYTKGDCVRGYNLHFESGDLKSKIKMQSKLSSGETPNLIAAKVVYEEKEQIKIVKQVVNDFYEFSVDHDHDSEKFTIKILVDKLITLGAFFKKQCFQPENEYRFVVDLYLKRNGEYAAIKEEQEFCEKDGIFVPYVDFEFEPKALKTISISPSLDFKRARESVFRLTQKKFPQFSNFEFIEQSQIPLRY